MASPTSAPESLKGSSKPRLEVAPPYAFSLGREAVDLAARAGLHLDFWQQQALVLMLAIRPDGRWACQEYAEIVSRQNGKGSILEARALAGLFLLDEKLIMWSAHEYKTAMEGFRRLRTCLWNLGTRISDTLIDIDGMRVKISNTNGDEGFELLDTGQRVRFIARSKSSGRGFTGDVNIIDETFAYTDDQHSALLPTMSARSMEIPGPQIIYTSSPPLTGDTGEVLFRLRKRAAKDTSTGLGFRDWGAGSLADLPKTNLDDRKIWAAANPAFNVRISDEFIQSERESMSDEKFAIERLGMWPIEIVSLGGAINVDHWAALLDPESRREGAVAIGVDITPSQDYAAVVLYGHRADGAGHVQILDYRPGTEWIVPRLREWADALSPMAICAGRGTYATLKTDLSEAGFRLPSVNDVVASGDVVTLAGTDMTAATGQILEAVRRGSFRHTGQRELDAAISGAVTKQTGDSIAWSRKDAAADITPLVAFTLAKWTYEVRAPLLNYDVLQSIF